MAGIGTGFANYVSGLKRFPVAIDEAGALSANLPDLPTGVANERPSWALRKGVYKPGGGGILQRLGDAMQEPGMSGAFLRAAGATMRGGLGAGIEAGAEYMDQRHRREDGLAQQGIENSQRDRGLDIQQQGANTQATSVAGDLTIRGRAQREVARSNGVNERAALRRDGIVAQGQRIDSDDRRYIAEGGWQNDAADRGWRSREAEADRQFKAGESLIERRMRLLYGDGSRPYDTVVEETPSAPAVDGGWFGSDRPATPKITVTRQVPRGPGGAGIGTNYQLRGGGAPAAEAAGAAAPAQAIQMLRSNPALSSQFDAKYGPGAAARALGR